MLVRSCDDSRGAMIAPVGMALSLQFALLEEISIEIGRLENYGIGEMNHGFESDGMDIEM